MKNLKLLRPKPSWFNEFLPFALKKYVPLIALLGTLLNVQSAFAQSSAIRVLCGTPSDTGIVTLESRDANGTIIWTTDTYITFGMSYRQKATAIVNTLNNYFISAGAPNRASVADSIRGDVGQFTISGFPGTDFNTHTYFSAIEDGGSETFGFMTIPQSGPGQQWGLNFNINTVPFVLANGIKDTIILNDNDTIISTGNGISTVSELKARIIDTLIMHGYAFDTLVNSGDTILVTQLMAVPPMASRSIWFSSNWLNRYGAAGISILDPVPPSVPGLSHWWYWALGIVLASVSTFIIVRRLRMIR